MTTSEFEEEFRDRGFLSVAVTAIIPTIRDLSGELFDLAERASNAFQSLTMRGADKPQTTAADPRVVALLLALRSASACQGAILMAERGMCVEARLLVRSVIENAICLGALHVEPETFMKLLWGDDEASRKAQANLILEHGLAQSEEKAKLEDLIAKIEKVRNLSIKDVAALSPYRRLYFGYRVLSNDSCHPSAKSLSRYITSLPDGSGWSGFNVGPSLPEEVDDCLLQLVHAVTAAGVAVTQIIEDNDGNLAIAQISSELEALMKVKRPLRATGDNG